MPEALNPLQDIIWRSASWFVTHHNSEKILWNFVFTAIAAEHSHEVKYKTMEQSTIIDEYPYRLG